ncbi:ABC transporter periplasmic component [Lentzea sp. NBRC 105346]|uniref:ABC transporter substrate-binding protein n=1 Tax=Lentzea sp. NBRC 105346 TaxID=3032205 RepID=UPI0024A1E857|nr:iron-siderophore ABC transporter substrate-binding protein [Lentzea sp. NBRC 105346]GLZ30077.1 ABC transporter periplasmic component [Lentzea sp. NBRC 105346]
MLRRTLGTLAAVGLVALTAACGGGNAAPSTATPGASDAVFPRTVTTAKGDVSIPKKPERVVVLDTAELDSVTLLGIKPVGAIPPHLSDAARFPEYLKDKVGDAKEVGTSAEPKLDLIASLKPDLILSNKVRHDKIYDQLSKIAPTVLTETTGAPWKANLAVHAKALGKEKEAADLLAAYEARAKKVGEAIVAKNGGKAPTVSITRFMAGKIRMYQKANFPGTVLADTGVTRPASQSEDKFDNEIGPELIDKADADAVFVTTAVSPEKTQKQATQASPLWAQMSAVKAGKVYEVKDEIWISGIGVQAAHLILDDLAKSFGVDANR